jgi:hypothetical protein
MKSKTIVFAALLIAAVMAFLAPRQASAGVTFSYFYESLLPYGDWVDVDQYGYCWAPRNLAPDWRPYTDGYWTYTDAGWTWVSYEDFGSITYHYGRWVNLEDVGWVWKPDYRWGPAWVSWRQSDRYMGWAPLPPDVEFNEDRGVGVWVDRDYDIGPSAYVFCETRYFGAPVVRNVILPVRRNVEFLDVTVNITNITVISSHSHGRLVYCGGPDYRWLEARSERPINRLELVLRTDGDWMQRRRPELSRSVGLQLFVDAPVIEPPHGRPLPPPRVAREIRGPRIDRGWDIVADPGARERIHQRYQEQTRGLTAQTAPAYRVNEADVRKVVREARPAPSGQPGVVQTQQRGSQQVQPTQQTVQQVQPSAQQAQTPSRGQTRVSPSLAQPQQQVKPSTQTQPTQPTARPQSSQAPQRVQPSAQQVQPAQTQNAVTTPAQQAPQVQRSPSEQRRPSSDQERNQQRQAVEATRNQQRQTEQAQAQRQQVEQQQRQAAESSRNQRQQGEDRRSRQESSSSQATPQAQNSSSKENRDNKDHKKNDRDRVNDPANNP